MPWTSLDDEAALYATLAETGRVAVDVIGQSVRGHPIRLLRIGTPPPAATARAALLFIGQQHGGEVAGREALLAYAQHLATTADTTEVAFLAAHGVLMIPTMNPDEFLSQRNNANDFDLNRDHILLSQPETRALHTVLGKTRPVVALDLHEAIGVIDPGDDIAFAPCTNPATHADVLAEAADLRDVLKARLTADSWTAGDYPAGQQETNLHGSLGLRHTIGVLVETNRGKSGVSEQDRTDMQYAAIDETLHYVATNHTTLLALVDGAAVDKAAEGAAGVDPFQLRVTTINPPPLGYRLSGVDYATTVFQREAFNIHADGAVVSMAQAAQPVIPYLLDAASATNVANATRMFDLTPALDVITSNPADLAPIVSGAHDATFDVRILTAFQAGPEPDGVSIPISLGDVQYDGTAAIFATVELVTTGQDPDTGRSLFPRRATDLLAPYGDELFVRRGVDLGSHTVWVPLGYFRIDTVEQEDSPYGPIRIAGSDRMSGVIDGRLTEPREYPPHVQVAAVFSDLVGDVHPGAPILFDDDASLVNIGRTLVADESRYEPLLELATAIGKVMFWDGEGVLRVQNAPDPDTPVWQVRAGRDGVAIRAGRRVTREGVFNGVVATGEGGDTDDPVRGMAVDVGPRSPTRWGGRFGRVPRYYASPFIRTEAQAQSAARAILARHLGAPYAVEFGAVVNPALRPGHAVRVTQRDGNRELHVLERVAIPLTADQHMFGETREKTLVAVGAVIA